MPRDRATAALRLPLSLAILLLLGSCARFPITEEITIEISNNGTVATITAQTTFDLEPKTEAIRARIAAARSAALAGVDPWAVRFARVSPEYDRTTFEKSRGVLERVTRVIRIPTSDLQLVLSDTSITVAASQGSGWRELAFYPGTSSRASREQQRRFSGELHAWSASVTRYFVAVDQMYAYLADQPGRAQYLFAAVLDERSAGGAPPVVLEEEQPFVDAVVASMEIIAAKMDEESGNASTFAEMADLVYNPFPGKLTIRLPHPVLSVDGFAETNGSRDVVIEPIDLLAAVTSLEGRWIEPDPLAALLRAEVPSAREMAAAPRRSASIVNSSEVESAITAQLTRPRTYSVRWAE